MALKDLFKKKYQSNVWCNNCRTFQEIQIPKGVSIAQFIDGNTGKCLNCGCSTLVADYPQIDEFKEQPKPKVRLLMRNQNIEPLQRAPLPSPRPSNRPANLLPKPRQQPGAEGAVEANYAAEAAEGAGVAEYAIEGANARYVKAAKRAEPGFIPRKGVYREDIDFWTGEKKGDKDETY